MISTISSTAHSQWISRLYCARLAQCSGAPGGRLKKYLVTGGAGFIGSHITRALLEQGAYVRILDNFSSGKRENVKALTQQFDATQLEVLEGDVRDASRVMEAVRAVEVVFHEAAFVSVPQSMQEPQECFDVNITGTSLLFDAARKAGVRRAVVA